MENESSTQVASDRGGSDTRPVSGALPFQSVTYARGQSIGRYMVVEMLGRGGMGQVYGAFDPELDRKVAIKILRDDYLEQGGNVGRTGIEPDSRLHREAQALAKLSHPNVLPVFDVGAADGRVFIAMEYVDGSTLAEWLAVEARAWREVVGKFVAAGRGLVAAHTAGFIHRDFKPHNVLIGKDGSVRVMDFGLARRQDGYGRRTGHVISPVDSSDPTVTATVNGTPPYMAPEQHRGEALDPSADQYAFCVALYYALHGSRPFANAPSVDLLRAKERMDLRALPPGAESRVPRWLRNAVLRGLQPDRAKRWPSMDALLRVLDRDPWQTTSRMAAAATAVALALGGGWAYGQAEERRAELCSGGPAALAGVWDDAAQARIGQAFRASGVADAEAIWGRIATTLHGHTEAWIDTHREVCRATHVRKEQSEDLLDLRMACLERHLRGVRAITDVFERADAQVVDKAIKVVATLRPVDDCARLEGLQSRVTPPIAADKPRVDALRDRIAEMDVLDTAGKYDVALAMAQDVFEEAKQVGYVPVIAEAQHFLGGLQGRVGNYEDAVHNLSEAGWSAEGVGHDEVAAKAQITVASILGYRLAQPEAGLAWGRHAQAVVARLESRDEYEGMLHAALASVHATAGDWDEAYRHDRRALEARVKALGSDHIEVAAQHNNLAIDATSLGRPEEALEHYEKAIDGYRKVFGPRHPHIGIALGNLANTLRLLGRYREAQQRFDESLPLLEATVGPDHPYVGIMAGNHAKTMLALGDVKSAHEEFERAIRVQKASMGAKGPYLVDVVLSFSEALVDDRQLERAKEAAAQARSLVQGEWTEHGGYNAGLLYIEGRLHAVRGDHREAIACYRRGLEWIDAARTSEVTEEGGPGWRGPLLLHLGRSLIVLGEGGQAIVPLEQAWSLSAQQHEPVQRADAALALAHAVLVASGDRLRARDLANRALEDYAQAGEGFAARRRDAAAWIHTHL